VGTVLIVLALGLAMLAWEQWLPGQPLPVVAGWWPRTILLNAAQALIAWVATVTWNKWLPEIAIWHAGGHGVILDAVLGYVAITFVYYWWHRARHEVPFLWRWFHQVHHSASRIEVVTSFYKHPLEIAVNGVLSSLIVFTLLGLNPVSAGLAFAATGLAELFYHWNVRTPYWLGYVFQRPESHRVHHQRGLHTNNFSDLPLWDLLFGTFKNPRLSPAECGLSPAVEPRLGAMLLGIDVENDAPIARTIP
jgi:sterol desaturase/sphingolipid hydroxylase (fatty acid hydroxylase superfamily)